MSQCPKCPVAKEICSVVAKEQDIECSEVRMDEDDNRYDAYSLQIVSAPSIVINDDVVFRGVVPSREELLNEINKRK
ncbi:thioredoxin family protein [Candidatus Woesearchaeota archaeon]|nr:MAG: thioredoxin family protein [Candidatus Woesearchaeota archaeon]